jgi:hypothetical protein
MVSASWNHVDMAQNATSSATSSGSCVWATIIFVIPEKIWAAVLWPGAIETAAWGEEVVDWIAGGVFSGCAPEFSALEDIGAAGVAGGGIVLEPSIKAFQSRSLNETHPALGQNPVLYRSPEAGLL